MRNLNSPNTGRERVVVMKLKPVGWWCVKCGHVAKHRVVDGHPQCCWCYARGERERIAGNRKHWKRVWVKA